MGIHIVINGHEVNNPVLKWLIIAISMLLSAAITAAILVLVLPLIGVTLVAAISLAVFIAMLVLSVVIYFGLGAAIFAALHRLFKRRTPLE